MLMGERASLKWKVGSNNVIKEVNFVVLKRMNFRRKNQLMLQSLLQKIVRLSLPLRGDDSLISHFYNIIHTQAVSRWLPTAAILGSSPGLVMWDFVVDKVALGQVFSEYFGFLCQS
jgi:hypothetical protein